jgi:hypothetical protein
MIFMPSVICLLALLAFGFATWALVKGPEPWARIALFLITLIELIHCVPLSR